MLSPSDLMFFGFGQDQICCWVYARFPRSRGLPLSPSDLVFLSFRLCHVGDAHMAGPVGTYCSGRTIVLSTEAFRGTLSSNGPLSSRVRSHDRPPAGTGGSGRTVAPFVDRGRRPRFDSRRPLAAARPEQEVPAEASSSLSSEAGGRGMTPGATLPSPGRNRRFRPNVASPSGSGRTSLHRPSFEHPRPEQVVPVASSLHRPRHIAEVRAPEAGTGGSGRPCLCPSYSVRGQGVTRPKYVSRRDPAEV